MEGLLHVYTHLPSSQRVAFLYSKSHSTPFALPYRFVINFVVRLPRVCECFLRLCLCFCAIVRVCVCWRTDAHACIRAAMCMNVCMECRLRIHLSSTCFECVWRERVTRVVQFTMTLGLPFENEATHRKMFIPNTTLKFTWLACRK